MGRHLSIDGDIIIFRCGFAAEKTKYHVTSYDSDGELDNYTIFDTAKEAKDFVKDNPDTAWTVSPEAIIEPLKNALYSVKHVINGMISALDADSYDVFIKGPGNFREEIATILPYKGNRDKDNRPFYEDKIRKYLIKSFGAQVVVGQETDDALGIQQYADYVANGRTKSRCNNVICSLDKDLDTVPGWHYNWLRPEGERLYWVTAKEATKKFYTQLLTGDSSDNIQGLAFCAEATRELHKLRKSKGCGPASADKILDGLDKRKDMYMAARNAYRATEAEIDPGDGCDERADAKLLENARLLYIRREENEMWSPPV